ncbi:MAG: DUF3108 domain-containing protein [Leptospirillum sp.]
MMQWLKKIFHGIGFLIVFPGFCLAQTAPLLGPDHFSATIESSFDGRTVTSRFYLSHMKVRLEPQLPGSLAGDTYEIILPGSGTMTMVLPERHLCMKKNVPPQTEAQIQAFAARAEKSGVLTVVGHETLDGHPVVVSLLAYHSPNPDNPRTIKFWNATDLENVPLREVVTMANGNVYTLHYKNIDLSDPSPSLFIAPANCSRFPDIKSLMKNFGMGGHLSIP